MQFKYIAHAMKHGTVYTYKTYYTSGCKREIDVKDECFWCIYTSLVGSHSTAREVHKRVVMTDRRLVVIILSDVAFIRNVL